MSSALQRAREEAMRGGGDWLDNDTLIANQLVFYITDVKDDRGGGFNGQDRWLVRVEPFYENEEDPMGLVSLSDNPARRKFMTVLDGELEQLVKDNEDPVIGPCVMVRLKGKNYRYIEIVDWNDETKQPVLPQGATPAGARVEDDMRPPRRPRSQPENGGVAAQDEEKRPFAGAVEAKQEAPPAVPPTTPAPRAARSTRTRTSAAPSSPATTTSQSEFLPIKEWARSQGYEVPEGRGRVKTEIKEAYERAKLASMGQGEYAAPTPASLGRDTPKPYQGSQGDVGAELARNARQAPEPAMDVPVGAPSRELTNPAVTGPYERAQAMHAQQVTFRPGMTGTSAEPCPSCGQTIHDRIFPWEEQGSGVFALVHARCEAGGEQRMMKAVPDAQQA